MLEDVIQIQALLCMGAMALLNVFYWLLVVSDGCYRFVILPPFLCGNSSVGRASGCHPEGREFESRLPLHFNFQKFN